MCERKKEKEGLKMWELEREKGGAIHVSKGACNSRDKRGKDVG